VTLDSKGERAAEHGHSTGRWRSGDLMGGDYLPVWRKVTGHWVIERELSDVAPTTDYIQKAEWGSGCSQSDSIIAQPLIGQRTTRYKE
jgi:hypothetical protein